MTNPTIRKNTNATKTCNNNPKQKQQGRQWIALNVRFKYGNKNSDRNPQNWAGHRSNSTCPLTTCSMYRDRFFGHISLWVTNSVVQLISIVSLRLEGRLHQFSPWSGRTTFGDVIQILSQKCRQKLVNLSFVGYLGEIESDSQTV